MLLSAIRVVANGGVEVERGANVGQSVGVHLKRAAMYA